MQANKYDKYNQSGRFNRRVAIYGQTMVDNAMGEKRQDYVVLGKAWARIEPLRGIQYRILQQIENGVTTKITIRYREGIKPTMRILYGADTWFEVIDVIEPNFDRRNLELMCREWQVSDANSSSAEQSD